MRSYALHLLSILLLTRVEKPGVPSKRKHFHPATDNNVLPRKVKQVSLVNSRYFIYTVITHARICSNDVMFILGAALHLVLYCIGNCIYIVLSHFQHKTLLYAIRRVSPSNAMQQIKDTCPLWIRNYLSTNIIIPTKTSFCFALILRDYFILLFDWNANDFVRPKQEVELLATFQKFSCVCNRSLLNLIKEVKYNKQEACNSKHVLWV